MDPVERLDAVVIGGGVVGLSVARALAMEGREVVVLEAETVLGSHISSRNSEVIHAGIYYPTGSLKARLCVSGKEALYPYCEAAGVMHARLGKLIVATRDEELPVLDRLRAQAEANGVRDLVSLSTAEIRSFEPVVTAVGGLLSPSTGIIDSHGLMAALLRDTERAGGQIVLSSPVLSGKVTEDGIRLDVGGPERTSVLCSAVVNAAGLFAQSVARRISGLSEHTIPDAHFAKGHYFAMTGKSPFTRLVYPVPALGGLGVHVTLDLGGQARFGPDVSYVEDIDYRFEEGRAASFYAAIRRYYPGLPDGALLPGYTGVRPKLGPAGSPPHDFVVQGPLAHGVPGLVNLYGIESPGLTAALALGELTRALLS